MTFTSPGQFYEDPVTLNNQINSTKGMIIKVRLPNNSKTDFALIGDVIGQKQVKVRESHKFSHVSASAVDKIKFLPMENCSRLAQLLLRLLQRLLMVSL